MSSPNNMIFGTRDSEGNILKEYEFALMVKGQPDFANRKCSTCEDTTKQSVVDLFTTTADQKIGVQRAIYTCTVCGELRIASS